MNNTIGHTFAGSCVRARPAVLHATPPAGQPAPPASPDQQQAALRGAAAGCSLSWMPPLGCCGTAALGSLQACESEFGLWARVQRSGVCGRLERAHPAA